MKRNENLVPLSRDHHFGLLCAWKIEQGIKKGVAIDRIVNYVNYFWDHHLQRHFDIEDEFLPNTPNSNLQEKMEQEHQELKELITSINSSPTSDLLLDFAKGLRSHIRFEERVVFPEYEQILSEGELDQIGQNLMEHHVREQDNYEDEFWV